MQVTAIDVLLDPDQRTVSRALAAHTGLRACGPNVGSGLALDADHARHITVLQRFVRTADLAEVSTAVAEVSAPIDLATPELRATTAWRPPVAPGVLHDRVEGARAGPDSGSPWLTWWSIA